MDTTETETDGERTPMKLGKNLPLLTSAAVNYNLPDCSPLNLQVIKPSGVATPTIVSGSGALTYHSSPSSSYSVGTSPGNLRETQEPSRVTRSVNGVTCAANSVYRKSTCGRRHL